MTGVERRPRPGEPEYVDERETTGRRGYSWPPFEAGHELSMRHGANSQRRLGPVAARLEAEVVEVAPWCAQPAFGPAVRAWALAEAACELYQAWFSERGLFGEDGKPTPGLERWDRAEARASRLRAALGLTPQSLARLLGTLAGVTAASGDEGGIAALRAEGRHIIAAHEVALGPVDEQTS
jgi:hypothetical protein